MTNLPPSWAPFDPDSAPELSREQGHVVALVSLPGLDEAGDGPGLATEIVRAWSRAGNRVVLADLGISDPRLHRELGLENRDGVSDSVTFGASVGRVTQAVATHDAPFFFISAGTAVADPGSLLEHPRWEALCRGFQEAGATLAAFVPWGAATRPQVLRRCTAVVFLGAVSDDPSVVDLPAETRVLAFVGNASVEAGAAPPREAASAPAGPEADPVAPEGGDPFDAMAAEGPPELAGDAAEPEPGTGEASEAPVPLAEEILAEAGDAPEPATPMAEAAPRRRRAASTRPPRRPTTPVRRSRSRGIWIVVLVVVVAVVVGWLLGVVPTPWASAPATGTTPPAGESVPPLSAAEPGGADEPAEEERVEASRTDALDSADDGSGSEAPRVSAVERSPAASWGVAVEAHEDRAAAWQRVAALTDVMPEQPWIVVPVEVDGAVYHRVVFGAAPSWTAVVSLRDRIAGELSADPARWIPRPTQLAYRLGETATLEEARAFEARLLGRGVPAYVMAVSYEDGTERFRLYAGGFEDAAEAGLLGEMLAEAGLPDAPLVDRTGRHPG